MQVRRLFAGCATVATAVVLSITSAAPAIGGGATSATAHRTVGVVRDVHARFDANQSSNWSGYNKGLLETGAGFHAISAKWVVPAAQQKVRGQQEFSSSWIGIGGGCLDTSCTLTDSTLIQAGTEQDVASDGTASYSTWFELIPAPSISTPLAVTAGDLVSAGIVETVPGVWTITLTNVTSGRSWSQTVPYSSTYATAEWIEETPLTFGTGGAGLSSMPALGTVHFDRATVNGSNAALTPAEEMQLVSSSGAAIATPSAPDTDADGFNDCTFASACAAPTTELPAG
jgi:hypothetical protein